MKIGGFIAVYRQIMESRIWTVNQRFDYRSAWIHILLETRNVPTSRGTARLAPGETVFRLEELTGTWHWTEAEVRTFLAWISDGGMVDYEIRSGWCKIRVLNWKKYQITGGRTAADFGSTAVEQGNVSTKYPVHPDTYDRNISENNLSLRTGNTDEDKKTEQGIVKGNCDEQGHSACSWEGQEEQEWQKVELSPEWAEIKRKCLSRFASGFSKQD